MSSTYSDFFQGPRVIGVVPFWETLLSNQEEEVEEKVVEVEEQEVEEQEVEEEEEEEEVEEEVEEEENIKQN
jgi:hypothetical protein